MLKAIFWDNDGVLVQTEHYYFQANREVLGEVGIDLQLETFCRISLLQGESVLDLADLPGPKMEALRRRRNERYAELLATQDILIPGVSEVLQRLRGRVQMGVVTSSRRDHFDSCHARSGLLDYFDFVLTREDYRHSKPHPDPYLRALDECRLDPDACLAIEDTPRGLLAARRAGLRCAVLPNPALDPSLFPGAYRILQDHADIIDLLETFD